MFPLGNGDSDEIFVLYKDNTGVSIDGGSLWTCLRSSFKTSIKMEDLGQVRFFKFLFQTQEEIQDIVSCGPCDVPFLSLHTTLETLEYTNKFIGVGSNPMICYYAIHDDSVSLARKANRVALKVTSAMSQYTFSSSVISHYQGHSRRWQNLFGSLILRRAWRHLQNSRISRQSRFQPLSHSMTRCGVFKRLH